MTDFIQTDRRLGMNCLRLTAVLLTAVLLFFAQQATAQRESDVIKVETELVTFEVSVTDSAGRPVLRGLGLFHGKRGYGLSVEFNVQTGPITILGMTQTPEGRLKLLAAQGECIPGARLEIGNTNSRLRFGLDPATFMDRWCEHGPTHHVALGVGHQVGKIRKLARLLNLELAVVG